jgi:general transcription factor 3C polypeptide 3 (transcription factor C subunit 4)
LDSYQSILDDSSNAILEELQDQFGSSFDINADLEDTKKRRGKKLSPKKIPGHLNDILGNANMAYTLGNYAEAVQLLNLIIKESPTAPQPWLQLAMIHDELGEPLKALQVYLVAAHLTKKDADLWKRLGDMFKSFQNNEQAIYCWSKAIRLNPQDTDSLWERSLVYKEIGYFGKAINGLKEILKVLPNDVLTVSELSEIYRQIGKGQDALDIFESMMNSLFHEDFQPITHTLDGCELVGQYSMGVLTNPNIFNVGYEEVNILVNLYISISAYDKAAEAIIAWVEKLKQICFTDPMSVDSDFDLQNDIPIELRVKLGICRLHQGAISSAKLHFQRLMIFPPTDYIILFREVADAFIFHNMHHDALSFLELCNQGHQLEPNETFLRMAKCYHSLGDSETAINFCKSALSAKPNDVDSKMMLAVLYENIGNHDKARQLAEEAEEITKSRLLEEEKKAIDFKSIAKTPAKKIDILHRIQEEKLKVLEARELFEKINSMMPNAECNAAARKDCLRYMRKLVLRFTSTADFYPSERSKEFTGISSLRSLRRVSDPDVDELLQADAFQGISFEDWFNIFIMHSRLSTFDNQQEEAQEVLKSAFDSNVFFHQEEKKTALKLHAIASALYASDFEAVSELCRYFLNNKLLANDMYHLYIACLSRGYGALEYFCI